MSKDHASDHGDQADPIVTDDPVFDLRRHRDRPSQHIFGASQKWYVLTHHQYHRLLNAKMIEPCEECTENADPGMTVYHVDHRIKGIPYVLEASVIALLQQTLH